MVETTSHQTCFKVMTTLILIMRKLFKSLVADMKDTKITLFTTLQRNMKSLVRKQTSVT